MAGIANTLKRMTQTTRGRVGLLVAILGVVWLGSALFAHLVLGEFASLGDALWSGVTHLLDPSSLHEDHGFEHRAVGLFQVVFGLIFLVGLAFTVISEVVGSSLERLGQYDAPLRVSDHLLLIGDPDVMAGFLPHLAGAHGRRVGTDLEVPRDVVVLADESHREARGQYEAELRHASGRLRVQLVIGDVAGAQGFDLAAARDARAIVVAPRSSREAAAVETADLDVIQSGTRLRAYLEELEEPPARRRPSVFLLFRRGRDVDAAWELFPDDWDALVGDRSLAAMMRIVVMRPQFGGMLPMLGPAAAGGIFSVAGDGLAGVPFPELAGRFESALPVGLLRGEGRDAHLLVAPGEVVADRDRVVVLAPERTAADRLRTPPESAASGPPGSGGSLHSAEAPGRILVVGWSDLGRALVLELASDPGPIHITVLASARQRGLSLPAPDVPQVTVEHIEGPTTEPAALADAVQRARPDVALVVAAPIPGGDLRTADAQAVLSLLQLRQVTKETGIPLVGHLFAPMMSLGHDDPRISVMSSQDVISSALVLTVIEPGSAIAAERLLGGQEARLEVEEYRPAGGADVTFAEIYEAALADGGAALGVASAGRRAVINPPRDARVRPGDALLLARGVEAVTSPPPQTPDGRLESPAA